MIPIFCVLVFFVGACIGSFLNVCIARWPANESVVKPRSRCPRCGTPIAWYDNVPVLSWLVLRAKCRHCQAPISAIYPVIETAVGVMWIASVWAFGPSIVALRVAVFATILLGIAMTDLQHYLIPDGFTVTGLLFVLATSLFDGHGAWASPFASPLQALLGACVGAGAITIIGWLGEVALKKEAMGFGDATLMAMAGAALGPGRAVLTIFVGALLAAVGFLCVVYPISWLRSRARGAAFEPPLVPFGVFLAPAALLTLLFGERTIHWYLTHMLG